MKATKAKAPVTSPVEIVYNMMRLTMEFVLAKLYSDWRLRSKTTSVSARIVSVKNATAVKALIAVMSVVA